jgi:hypothetical protein
MGSGTRVECRSCSADWDISDGLLLATADDGSRVACPHPLEIDTATMVIGKGGVGIWWSSRLKTMSCWLCFACWNTAYYTWTLRGIIALTDSDFERATVGSGDELIPVLKAPAQRLRRCASFQCAVCRRRGPWLLWPEWIISLLLLPLAGFCTSENGTAPLPCPRCRKRGLRIEPWIS